MTGAIPQGDDHAPQHVGDYLALHQTVRSTISNLDTILVNLLTQGNAFVLAILSVPIAAKLEGMRAASIALFALILAQFLLLANVLYRGLLKRAVMTAKDIETRGLVHLDATCRVTEQLNKTTFSADKGSLFLYLVLPVGWMVAAAVEGYVFLSASTIELRLIYVLCCVLVLAVSFGVWGYLGRKA